MAERFESYEEKLRIAGQDTAAVDRTVRQLAAKVTSAMSVGSAAWGPDKFGTQFADGPDGFVASMDKIVTGTERMAASFRSMSDGQYRAADAVQNYEQASAENFGR